MTFEPKDGTGGLWKNQNASSDKHPTAKGYIIAHRDIKQGERLDLAAWTKTDRNGNKWQSLKMEDEFKPRTDEQQEPAKDATGQEDDPSDSIPF